MAGFSDLDLPQSVTTVTTTYQASNTDTVILATASSAFTVTLPALAGVPNGHVVTVAKNAGANAITVSASGTDKFNGVASGTIAMASAGTMGRVLTLMSAGSTWVIIGSYNNG
jgi:hypothetical protein